MLLSAKRDSELALTVCPIRAFSAGYVRSIIPGVAPGCYDCAPLAPDCVSWPGRLALIHGLTAVSFNDGPSDPFNLLRLISSSNRYFNDHRSRINEGHQAAIRFPQHLRRHRTGHNFEGRGQNDAVMEFPEAFENPVAFQL